MPDSLSSSPWSAHQHPHPPHTHPQLSPAGGFRNTGPSITLCENKLLELRGDQKDLDTTLAHELVHAYDHCVTKTNWSNLRHHACSEIRAANLSGDCGFKNEIDRGHFRVGAQHPRCVRRRAALSISSNANCTGGMKQALEVVDSVFDACYNDHAPFDYQP